MGNLSAGRGTPFIIMSMTELAASVKGELFFNFSLSKGISSVAVDSRNVKSGGLFVPLRGVMQDGHSYIEEALKAGAVCFFADYNYIKEDRNKCCVEGLCKKYSAVCIAVKNNMQALQNAAAAYLKKYPALLKIGITGSSGKTTVKEIIASIFSQKYKTFMSEGNLNSETGLPLSVFCIRPEHEAAVLELGMNRRGEIAELAEILLPNFALITNIGSAHIGILGSRQAIVEEKKQIFSKFSPADIGFVPVCEFTDFLKDVKCGKVFVYGSAEIGNLKKIELCGIDGSKIFYGDEEILFPLAGKHNADNAVAAIALSEKAGFSAKEIKAGLEAVKPLFGRSQIKHGLTTCLFDCYNANPDSMSCALEFCSGLENYRRKIYVLGSMLELGAQSFEYHKKICIQALNSGADEIYFFGDEISEAAKTVEGKCGKFFLYKNSEIERLRKELSKKIRKGDFVLLKGSRGLALERLEDVLIKGAGIEN